MLAGPLQAPFVGREEELATLLASLDAACQGQGLVVLLAGEPGISKTRLAEELTAGAGARGVQALWGRCYEGEGAPPFWPWVQLLRACLRGRAVAAVRADLGPGAADIAQLVPEVRALLPDLPVPPELTSDQARFRLFDSITLFLAQVTATGPLVLVLDDLQWVDIPSLQLLTFLAREVHTLPLLLVGTYRDLEVDRTHPLAPVLADLQRTRGYTHIALGGLTPDAVNALLACLAPELPADGQTRLGHALHARARGNPFFIREAVRHLAAAGRLSAAAPARSADAAALATDLSLPEGMREVIRRRLARLSAAGGRTLTLAAILGREFGVSELARAAELTGDALLEALEEAETAQVIAEVAGAPGRYAFAHDLIRETLYADLPATRRARLHRQVGMALEGLWGDDPEHLAALAWHFAQAAPAGDADKAVTYAERAAARAMRLYGYEEAAAHYASAVRLLALQPAADEGRRAELLLALGLAQRKAGELQQALDTFRQVVDIARRCNTPTHFARAALGFEDAFLASGMPRQAVADPSALFLEEALRAVGAEDGALRARLLAALARTVYFAGTGERAATLSAEGVAVARRAGDPAALAHALDARRIAIWGPDRLEEGLAVATELLQAAADARDQELALEGHRWRFAALLELGALAAADREIAAYTRRAEEVRQPHYLANASAWRAMRALLEGRFEEGEQIARQALALGQRAQSASAFAFFGLHRFAARSEQGGLAELESLFEDLAGPLAAIPAVRCFLAAVYAELGRAAEARRHLEELAGAGGSFADLPRDWHWLGATSQLAAACAALGDTGRAAPLYELLRPYAGRVAVAGGGALCFGVVARYLGLLATTLRRWQDAARQFEDALALSERLGARPWLARTRHDYAAMLLARGRPEDQEATRGLLDRAMMTARELRMHRLAEQVTALQARLAPPSAAKAAHPARPAFPAGLTAREVEVLQLVATGKTNKEIAEALVFSPGTVTQHLVHIYTKIGARRRADAAAFASRHGLLPPPQA